MMSAARQIEIMRARFLTPPLAAAARRRSRRRSPTLCVPLRQWCSHFDLACSLWIAKACLACVCVCVEGAAIEKESVCVAAQRAMQKRDTNLSAVVGCLRVFHAAPCERIKVTLSLLSARRCA